MFRRRRNKIPEIAKVSSAKPPITPPMIGPRCLGPLKDTLEVPSVEVPLIALEVPDDEPVGNVGDDMLYCTRRAERVKGVVEEFPL